MLLASRTKVNNFLFPMDLRKYMVISFGILWTLVLITALTAAIVHNINFQKSHTHIHLMSDVATLERTVKWREEEIQDLKLELLKAYSYLEWYE